MTFERGDVVLVFFPDSNLRTGKLRPALVVQASDLNTGIPQTVVAMMTSKTMRADHPSRVMIVRGTDRYCRMGLRVDSVLMTDNLVTVSHGEIRRCIGRCDDMADVDTALRHTLGLS
jgi:mRNA interferase MazF